MTLESALTVVAQALNEARVAWAVGGSVMLLEYGFAEEPNDLDVLVALSDADKSHEALRLLGEWERGVPKPPFPTRHFYRYRIRECDVEVIAGFRIDHEAGTFELPFDRSSLVRTTQDTGLPLSLLEDWWLLFSLMPSASKQAKAERIYRSLTDSGEVNKNRLRELSDRPLPDAVRKKIYDLIGNE